MKKIILITALIFALALQADEKLDQKSSWPFVNIAEINLNTKQTVKDAIDQIIAGLPADTKNGIVVEISDADLALMPIREEFVAHDIALHHMLKYLEKITSVGCRFENNTWHISTNREDDIIETEYITSKEMLKSIGIFVKPDLTIRTIKDELWPNVTPWTATYITVKEAEENKEHPELSTSEHGKLRVLANRRYHEEIKAVILLKSLGYETLSLAPRP